MSRQYCPTHGHFETFSRACIYCGRTGCARLPAHWVNVRATLCERTRASLRRKPRRHPRDLSEAAGS